MLVALWLFFWASLSNGTTGHNGFDCSTNPTVSSCWTAPEGATSYTISDDGYAQVDLPFSFPFYGDYYGTSFMHSNGVVSLPYNNATYPTHHFCCNGYDLEAAINNGTYATSYPQFHHFIAVLWTDLISINKDIDGDGINDNGYYTWTETADDGSEYQHYLWRNLSEFYNPVNNNTVGLSLEDNGGIIINHSEVDIRNHAVNVGIYGDPTNDEIEQIYYGYGKNSTWSDTNQQYTGIPSYDITAFCNQDPLFNASCPGYAEAYAELLYNQACTAEPLYDSGCTGYSEAIQSCNDNPLSNQLCPDYNITVTQCEINDLFYTYCPNYQSDLTQCDIDSQSNLLCPNYSYETDEETVIETIPDEEFEVSITGDSVVDNIINDEGLDISILPDPVIEEPIIEEEIIEEEIIEEEIIEDEVIEEPIIEDEVIEEPIIEDEVIEDEVVEEKDEPKKKSKKEKIRDLMIKKAKSLADDMGKAATAEQQAMIQQQVMAVMAYVYGFDQYKITMNGGYYPDNSWYRPSLYPDNNFGARNGLAQELLWNDMVDMQYK